MQRTSKWGRDGELTDLLKEEYIVERPYSQAFCLIMSTPDLKQSGSSQAPYYKPLQNFENALRKAGLVPPPPPFHSSMAMEQAFQSKRNQKITG